MEVVFNRDYLSIYLVRSYRVSAINAKKSGKRADAFKIVVSASPLIRTKPHSASRKKVFDHSNTLKINTQFGEFQQNSSRSQR